LLAENPGLKSELAEIFAKAYEKARVLATDETRYDEAAFPVEAPFTLQEVLDSDFWPENGCGQMEL
jgi:hypothetical protein